MRLPAFVKRRYGGPHEPLCYGNTERYDPATGERKPWLPLPVAGIPTTLAQNSPHEASPTGKSGVGYVTQSMPAQPVRNARPHSVIAFDRRPIYAGDAALVTQSLINPWDLISTGKKRRTGLDDPGAKWSG